MPWETLVECLWAFADLGARALEITGGGNPLLYRRDGKTINDIVEIGHWLGLAVGIITNARSLAVLTPETRERLSWVRVSLIGLDEPNPAEYDFGPGLEGKLGVSYIVNTGDDTNPLDKRGRYGLTTPATIERIAALLEANPHIRFCRIAGNCLRKGNNARVRADWLEAVDRHERMFVKDIGDADDPHPSFCGIGAFRPYVAADPNGDGYRVYACTSHVLHARTYAETHSLCRVEDIRETWAKMGRDFEETGHPYRVAGQCGGYDQIPACRACYYAAPNRLLEAVAHRGPDWQFA